MQELTGEVTKGAFASGSKSEHDAIFLNTSEGRYVLRRQGGNPFSDPELEGLVGKTIRCRGVVANYTFIFSQCEVLH